MKVLYLLILLIGYTVDPFILFDASYKLLKPKYSKKVCFWAVFVGIYILVLTKQILVFAGLSDYVVFCFPVLFAYIIISVYKTCETSLKEAIIQTAELLILSSVIDLVVFMLGVNIFHLSETSTCRIDAMNVLPVIISRGINIIIYKFVFLSIKLKRTWDFYKNTYLITLICNFIVAILGVIAYFVIQNNSNRILWGAAISGLFIGMEIVVAVIVIKKSNKDRRYIAMAKEKIRLMESQLSYAETMKELNEDIRKIRHEYIGHMHTIYQLMALQQYEEVTQYIEEMNQELSKMQDVVIIENPVLCAVITEMKQKARKQQIDCQTTITVSKFPLNNYELSSLIYNIFENAIEACSKVAEVEQRKLSLTIANEIDNTICIHCKNTKAEPVIMNKRGKIETTKHDKNAHGLGLGIIENIVHKYEGNLDICHDNRTFELSIWIPL